MDIFVKNKLQIVVLIVATLAVLVAYFVVRGGSFSPSHIAPTPSFDKNAYNDLKSSNANFAAGVDALNQGDFLAGRQRLNLAYDTAVNKREQSIVLLNEMHLYLRLGSSTDQKIKGVKLAGQLLDDDDVDADIKAYAILALVQWYKAKRDTELFTIIFSDSHFAPYVAPTTEESLHNLYKYSLLKYKLPLPLLEVARWDAGILNDPHALPEMREAFLGGIPFTLETVDGQSKNVEQFGNSSDLMAIDLSRARLLVTLELYTKEQKFGDPDEYFEKAYQRSVLNNVALTRGYILLSSARYHLSKKDDVGMKKSLDLFVADQAIMLSGLKSYVSQLANSKSLPDAQASAELRAMANKHAPFKKSLSALGFIF